MLYFPIIFEHFQGPETLLAKRLHRSFQPTSTLPPPRTIFIFVYFIRLCHEPHNYRSMCTLATYCIRFFQENGPETCKYEQEEKQEECYMRYFPFFFPQGFISFINIVTDSVNNIVDFFVCSLHILLLQLMFIKGSKEIHEGKLKGMEHKEIREGANKQNQQRKKGIN